MKKLILLAVVVFGFTAISVAQHTVTDNPIYATVLVPTSLNVDVTFVKGDYLSFGTVVSSPLYDGTLLVKANGQVVKTNVTTTGTLQPASFTITKLLSGTPIITLAKKHWNTGDNNLIQLDIIQDDPDYVLSTAGVNKGDFTVKVGGLLSVPANAKGSIVINDFSVTLNNQ